MGKPSPNQPEFDRRNDVFLTEGEAAARLNVSVKLMQKNRFTGGGPPYCKFGHLVRYPLSALLAYEASCMRTSTSQASAT